MKKYVKSASEDRISSVLYDIADEFSGQTSPLYGSWDNDTIAQIVLSAQALNCTLREAAQYMIDILGFDRADFSKLQLDI